MNDLEHKIFLACREADEKFEKDGAGGTKCWIREYFLPSLECHDLTIDTRANWQKAKPDREQMIRLTMFVSEHLAELYKKDGIHVMRSVSNAYLVDQFLLQESQREAGEK